MGRLSQLPDARTTTPKGETMTNHNPHLPALCDYCGEEIEEPDYAPELPGMPGDLFCSDECLRDAKEEAFIADCDARAYGPDYFCDGPDFADPGGTSALRRATPSNPRNLACPTCGKPDRLTPADRAQGYQCDPCADQAERGGEF